MSPVTLTRKQTEHGSYNECHEYGQFQACLKHVFKMAATRVNETQNGTGNGRKRDINRKKIQLSFD